MIRKLFIVVVVIIYTAVLPFPAIARTNRQDAPVSIVNPHRSIKRYTHYRMGRGFTRRCEGSCHRQEDARKARMHTYKPVSKTPVYASGASIVRKPKKNYNRGVMVYKYGNFKKRQPITYIYYPER